MKTIELNSKAPEDDAIENEAWRLMPKEIGEELVRLINKLWKGDGIPKEWRTGVICPILKGAEKGQVKNYRGVIQHIRFMLVY